MTESSTQVKRTKADVDQEYSRLAMSAGDFEFKLKAISMKLDQIYEKMSDLDKEAGDLVKANLE
jgi:peptidoglycan hydrolase CwlO-like protein